MKNIFTRKTFACLIFLANVCHTNVAANENTELMQNGMWKDPATGLIWSRCSLGLTWEDNKCNGMPQIFNSPRHSRESTLRAAREHSLGGFTDWRLPSIAELLTLRTCKVAMSPKKQDVPFEDAKILKSFESCVVQSRDAMPSISMEVFPDYNLRPHGHWASLYSNGVGLGWQAYFSGSGGFTERQFEEYAGYVRPVRSPIQSESAIVALFSKQLETQSDLALQEQRAQEARAAREAEVRRHTDAENEKRRQAEARAFQALLNAKDPQTMYLAAGRFERNGESNMAQQVYERLIERFPSSTWAVKANDQLLETRRVNSYNSTVQGANVEARERAFRACKVEMSSCYSRGGSNCYRNCESLR